MSAAHQSTAGSIVAQEKAKLQKALRRVDLVLFAACAIIAIATPPFTASAGGQAITWLVLSFFLFLIPYGLLVSELGTTFPAEGGPYEWARMAFGRLPGSITAILYWISNPIWIGGTLTGTAIAALNTFLLGSDMSEGWEIVFGLGFTWAVVGTAIIALRFGKWVPNVGLFLKAGLIVFFAGLAIAYLIDRGHTGTVGAGDLKPTISGFLLVIGVIMFNWLGFELANGASEEMDDPQRDVPNMIVGSGLVSAGLYAMLLIMMMLVIPESGLTNVAGFTDAYQQVAVELGGAATAIGDVVAIVIVLTLWVSGSTWLMGADRVQAIAALDGAAPAWMGRFSGKLGTPIAMNIMSGIMSSLFVIFVFHFSSGTLANFFAVMIALVISTTAMAYFFIFPALPVLRKKYPDVHRPYRVPGGMLGCYICAALTEFFTVVTAISLLWPGLIDQIFGQSYSIYDSWGVSRLFFETVTLGTFAVIIVFGLIFWYIGRIERARGVSGEEEVVFGAAASGD